MKRPMYKFLIMLVLLASYASLDAETSEPKTINTVEEISMMDLSLTVESVASAEVGEQVCLNLSVDQAIELSSLSFSLSFDSTILELDTINLLNDKIRGKVTDLFGYQRPGIDIPANGITFLWFKFGGSELFEADEVLFEYCFTVLKKEAVTVEILGTPECNQSRDFFCLEAFDKDSDQISNVTTNPGEVNASATGGGTPPVANFTADRTTINAGESVTFTDQSTNTPTTWSWTFTGGTPGNSSDQNPTITYNNPGTYPVTLTTTNGDGSDTETKNGYITVEAVPDQFTLDITDADGAVNSEVCVSINAFKFTEILGMLFALDYDTDILEFKDIQNINGVFGDDLTFGTVNPGTITVQRFSFEGTDVSVDDGATLFDVCFTVKSATGTTICFKDPSSSSNIEITDVNENVIPFNGNCGDINGGAVAEQVNAQFTASSTNIRVGESINFTDQSTGNPTNWSWTFTGGTPGSSSGQNPTGIRYNTPGTYTVTLVASNADGSDTETKTNFITVTEEVGTTCDGNDFKLDVTDGAGAVGDEVCVSVNVCKFTNILGALFALDYDPDILEFKRIQNINAAFNDDLTFGDPTQGGTEGTIVVQRFSFEGTDVTLDDGDTFFDICFTVKDQTETTITFKDPSSSSNIEITDVNENEIPFNGDPGVINGVSAGLNANFSADKTNVLIGEAVSFSDLSSGNPTDWEWTFPGGSPGTSTSQNPTVTYNTPGVYAVTLKITGADGMDEETKVAFITVSEKKTFDVFTLDLTDGLGEVGETVCVDVQAHKFTEIAGATFAIDYDPTKVQFLRTENLNEELSDSEFGLPGTEEGNLEPGSISYRWFPNDLVPRTLEDCEVMFTICFEVLIKEKAILDFKAPPVGGGRIEILDKDLMEIPFNGDPGEINGIQPPNISQANVTDVNCAGESTGTVDLSVNGGTGSFSYLWSFQNRITEDLVNVPAGQYSVTITDSGSGLITQNTYTISEPGTAIDISSLVANDISCSGETDGSIAVNATGGSGSLTYAWSSSLPAIPNQNNLGAGTYNLTVEDANGCEQTTNITINEPAAISVDVDEKSISCFGESDGEIALTVSGGTPNFSYNWSGGLTGNTPTQTGVGEGNYNVTITDGRGCMTVESGIEITRPAQLQISSLSAREIDTGNDGRVTLLVNGGTPDYTYSWMGPNDFTASTKDLVNLDTGGEYFVTITDQNNCSVDGSVFVKQQLEITDAIIQPACPEQANGSIEVIFRGGRADYTFSWSNDATSERIENVPSGTYNLTITDSDGEQITGNFEIGELAGINVVPNITLNTDGMNDGVIDLTVSGGQAPYEFLWDNGATTEDLGGLGRGEECVTITDNRGCTFMNCYAITAPLVISATKADASCNGQADGVITITVEGGNPPFTVVYSDDVIQADVDDRTISRNDLNAGMLTYTVTDENGTSIDGQVEITEPSAITLSSLNVVHDTEETGCTGAISIELTGGAGSGYAVSWNTSETGTQITNLCESTSGYIPTVTDADGCIKILDTIVVNTFTAEGSITLASCPNLSDGVVSLEVAGGEMPYTYEWLNDAGDQISTLKDPDNLPTGTVTVRISEQSGNTLSKVFTIGSSSELAIDIDILSDFNGFEVSCADATDGEIRATGLNSDNELSFEWTRIEEGGNMLVGMEPALTDAAAGTYRVKLIDDVLGCEVEEEVVLEAPPMAELQATITDVSCPGDTDGELRIEVIGGNTGFSYNYDWSQDANLQGPRAAQLAPGSYSVTATDINDCTAIGTFEINNPAPLSIELDEQAASERRNDDTCNGAVKLFVSGGTEPYSYEWAQLPKEENSELLNQCPGIYPVQITDANGCTLDTTGVVPNELFPCLEDRNVISPDGDGLNDSFILFCSEDLVDNNLEIYNRWGELVFEQANYSCSDNNPIDCFEGRTNNGDILPQGAYYYVLQYTDPQDGMLVQMKGSISIIRE